MKTMRLLLALILLTGGVAASRGGEGHGRGDGSHPYESASASPSGLAAGSGQEIGGGYIVR